MSELLHSSKIKVLCDDYYQQRITKEQYRKFRTELLNEIDREINNIESVDNRKSSDSGVVDKIMSFFKNSDEEKIL